MIFIHTFKLSSVTTQLSTYIQIIFSDNPTINLVSFESVIQKRVKFIAFDADNSDLFKCVSTIFMQFFDSFYNPNPEHTLENPKYAGWVATLTIRSRKRMSSNMFPLVLCDHLGLISQNSFVYTRKSEMSWESCNNYHSTQKKVVLFKYVSTSTVRSLGSHIHNILGIHSKIRNELREL